MKDNCICVGGVYIILAVILMDIAFLAGAYLYLKGFFDSWNRKGGGK